MKMAILDKPPAFPMPEGEPELLRYLYENPDMYAFDTAELEPVRGVEAIAGFAGQLAALSGTAIEFVSRLGYHLRLPQPQLLDKYPTIIEGAGRTRKDLTTVTFRFFNMPPFGRGELVTAYARPDEDLAARPIRTEHLHL